MAHKLVKRWNEFLGKIEERFHQILDEAEHGCAQLLDLSNLDPLPMSNAWSAIDAQIGKLEDKVQDTWEDRVEEKMEDAELDDKIIDKQQHKIAQLERYIAIEKEKREAKIFADAARKLAARGREILGKDFACTQCGGALPVPQEIFRSTHVGCSYCQATNTFEPGSEVRIIEAFCADRLAKEKTIDLWEAYFLLEEEVKEHSDAPLKLLKQYETAFNVYYQAYYDARAAIVPQYQTDVTKDLQGKMEAFYMEMAHEENWTGEVNTTFMNEVQKEALAQRRGSSLTSNGNQVYSDFMKKVVESGEDEYSMSADPYYLNCTIITQEEIEDAKTEIAECDFADDFISSLGDGGVGTLNNTDTNKPDRYDVAHFDQDEDYGNFNKMFPNLLPLAISYDESTYGECFLIDISHPAYPVIFWCHEAIVYAADDLATFLSTISIAQKEEIED